METDELKLLNRRLEQVESSCTHSLKVLWFQPFAQYMKCWFQPLSLYEVKTRFQAFAFKWVNLRRYAADNEGVVHLVVGRYQLNPV
jgi:hypothetical protein